MYGTYGTACRQKTRANRTDIRANEVAAAPITVVHVGRPSSTSSARTRRIPTHRTTPYSTTNVPSAWAPSHRLTARTVHFPGWGFAGRRKLLLQVGPVVQVNAENA